MIARTKTNIEETAIGGIATGTLPRVEKAGRVPIKSWAPDLEGKALEQAINLSNLPFAIDHVALMPDAHAGYGMPIGGVLFMSRSQRTVPRQRVRAESTAFADR